MKVLTGFAILFVTMSAYGLQDPNWVNVGHSYDNKIKVYVDVNNIKSNKSAGTVAGYTRRVVNGNIAASEVRRYEIDCANDQFNIDGVTGFVYMKPGTLGAIAASEICRFAYILDK